MTTYTDSERAVAIVTAALSAMTDEEGALTETMEGNADMAAPLLLASDPNVTGVAAVLVGMLCSSIADAALQREMAPIDYWRIACEREARRTSGVQDG